MFVTFFKSVQENAGSKWTQECISTPLHYTWLLSSTILSIQLCCDIYSAILYNWGQCSAMFSPIQYVLLFCGICSVHQGLSSTPPIPIFSRRSLPSTGLASNTNVLCYRTATAVLSTVQYSVIGLINIVLLSLETRLYHKIPHTGDTEYLDQCG